MDGSDTELIPSEEAFPLNGSQVANFPVGGPNNPPVEMQNLPPGTNVRLRRVNQAGVADGELARLKFAQQINPISVTTGTPIEIAEQLAERAQNKGWRSWSIHEQSL